MLPDTASTHSRTQAAGMSTAGGHQPDGEHPGHQDKNPAGPLTAAATALAGIGGIARCGGLDATAALSAITAARKLAAELEHGELAFIEAARSGGATWSQIAAAMGTGNRQTAQKRHADLARRCPCPPSVDMPAPPESRRQETGHDDCPASTSAPAPGTPRHQPGQAS
jgi:hypothetical protein